MVFSWIPIFLAKNSYIILDTSLYIEKKYSKSEHLYSNSAQTNILH